MSKAKSLGREEMVIEDTLVSGCMMYAAPLVFIVAAYFVRNSWRAVTGVDDPIIDDSRVLNFAVGLAIMCVGLLFCLVNSTQYSVYFCLAQRNRLLILASLI